MTKLADDEVLDQESLVSLVQIYNADQKLADVITASFSIACQPSSIYVPREGEDGSDYARSRVNDSKAVREE